MLSDREAMSEQSSSVCKGAGYDKVYLSGCELVEDSSWSPESGLSTQSPTDEEEEEYEEDEEEGEGEEKEGDDGEEEKEEEEEEGEGGDEEGHVEGEGAIG